MTEAVAPGVGVPADDAATAGRRRPGTALLALAAGGVLGVAQMLVAQRLGLLRFDGGRTGWWVAQLVALCWLSAVSVVLGALVARRLTHADPHRVDPFALGAAAFGSLLAVPLASSSAAWAAIYGGAVPTWQVVGHVLVGTALGVVAGAAAQRYRPVAVGVVAGAVVAWATAILSAVCDGTAPPVLGHPALGVGAGTGERVGALVVAVLLGVAIGVAWASARLDAKAVAASAGPGLVAVAYLATLPLTGADWPWSPVPTALAAVPCAALAACVAGWLADRLRRRHD
ncbi:MAG TPA: hypothetical protein VGN37_00475 [Actinocatenispora sp.]